MFVTCVIINLANDVYTDYRIFNYTDMQRFNHARNYSISLYAMDSINTSSIAANFIMIHEDSDDSLL